MKPEDIKIGQRVNHRTVRECGTGTVIGLPTGVNAQVLVDWDGAYGKTPAYAENLILVEQPKTAGHVHAKLMKQYAEDATKSETPWENWECTYVGKSDWEDVGCHPIWSTKLEYRRKPKQKFIELNGKKFEIFAKEPEHGAEYWCVAIPDFVVYNYTFNSGFDTKNFLTNNCFKDKMTAKDFAEELKKIFNNVVES